MERQPDDMSSESKSCSDVECEEKNPKTSEKTKSQQLRRRWKLKSKKQKYHLAQIEPFLMIDISDKGKWAVLLKDHVLAPTNLLKMKWNR